MNKSSKSFFIIAIIITVYIDTFIMFKYLLFYKLNKEVFIDSLYILTPLIVALMIYIFRNRHNSIKLDINYIFFTLSLLFFIFILIYYTCYAFVIFYNFNTIILLLLGAISVILLFLSFYKNLDIRHNYPEYINLSLFFMTSQFMFILFLHILLYDNIKIENPNRYNFVKSHFYSSSELTSFPEEIPKNALNLTFQYLECPELSKPYHYKRIKLEFDIRTLENEIEHFEYYKKEYK